MGSVTDKKYTILILSSSNKLENLLCAHLSPDYYKILPTVSTSNIAKRTLLESLVDILIVDNHAGETRLIRVSKELNRENLITFLFVSKSDYSDAFAQTQKYGIALLEKPTSAIHITSAINIASAISTKFKKAESDREKLKSKLDEIKTVSRAKILLIENEGYTEEKAHRFIEKKAMDRCVKSYEVAQEIISSYKN